MEIPDYMTPEEIRIETLNGEDIGMLSELTLNGWPSAKAKEQKDLQPYWSFRDKITITGGIAMKGRRITIPAAL